MFKNFKYYKLFTVIICLLAYSSLICAYYFFNQYPSWIQSIPWANNLQYGRLLLCVLEEVTLTIVIGLFVFSSKLPHIYGDLSYLNLLKINSTKQRKNKHTSFFKKRDGLDTLDYLIIIFSFSSVFTVSFYKIIYLKENVGIRISYSIFVFALQLFWLYSARTLLSPSLVSLKRTIDSLIINPINLFSLGRNLSSSLNSIAVSITIILVPLITIIPTLPININNFNINQRSLASIIGIVFCLSVLFIYLYTQIIIFNALNRSLQKLDNYIVNLLGDSLNFNSNSNNLYSIKQLIEIREILVKSISLPSGVSIFNTINISLILVAFINIALSK